jgi:3-hydroxyisobutyrate dehydrogenase-like beta-hydroxyacid dehydrogenase
MTTIGFIGLGVMGGPMCRNVALKHNGDVVAFDVVPSAFDILKDTKAKFVTKIEEIWAKADVVLMSLPGGTQVEAVCIGPGGLLSQPRKPWIVIDLSTTLVSTARKVAEALKPAGVAFADAPVARTREAAQKGQLSIMVGAPDDLFAKVEPWLRYMGTDVTHGGDVGTGQALKLINNTLVFENVMAIAEMMVLAERAGVKAEVMVDAVSKGSGDSFALRNHGAKAMVTRNFPEKSFPPEYVMKDLSYSLQLAQELNVPARTAELAMRYYKATAEGGYAGKYFPAVIEIIDKGGIKG